MHDQAAAVRKRLQCLYQPTVLTTYYRRDENKCLRSKVKPEILHAIVLCVSSIPYKYSIPYKLADVISIGSPRGACILCLDIKVSRSLVAEKRAADTILVWLRRFEKVGIYRHVRTAVLEFSYRDVLLCLHSRCIF